MAWIASEIDTLWRRSGVYVPGWAQNALENIATDLLLAALVAE